MFAVVSVEPLLHDAHGFMGKRKALFPSPFAAHATKKTTGNELVTDQCTFAANVTAFCMTYGTSYVDNMECLPLEGKLFGL